MEAGAARSIVKLKRPSASAFPPVPRLFFNTFFPFIPTQKRGGNWSEFGGGGGGGGDLEVERI